MRVLGVVFSGHGSSMTLVEDGRVVGAVNLERLTRVKFALATLPAERKRMTATLQREFGVYAEGVEIANVFEVFPMMLEYLTGETDLRRAGIDLIVKPADALGPSPRPAYQKFLSFLAPTPVHFDIEHHLCHAYQAYLASPFEDCAIVTIDGRGEKLDRLGGASLSTTHAVGEHRRVSVHYEPISQLSLGGMYSTVTRLLGFREEQEGNTMALAAFGTPRLLEQIEGDVVELGPDGAWEFADRPELQGHFSGLSRPREPGAPFTQDDKDFAFAMQAITERIFRHFAQGIAAKTGKKRLAMAGGVALNCVANTEILTGSPIEELYVMPNAGDRGLSLGAALYGYHVVLGGQERHPLTHDYLGKTYTEQQILAALRAAPDTEFRRCDDIEGECAALLAAEHILGWVQGGAEFGPRALGHRSILADPRTTRSKERLDREIKRREWFRPYAPSVLAEHADEYFEMSGPSPYMLLAVDTRPEVRDRVPGIVHVDGSARVQTVDRGIEPRFHRLISEFRDRTGIPMVLNTSFNGYGEPMVESPADAIRSLHAMGLDAVAIGDYLAWKAGSPPRPGPKRG